MFDGARSDDNVQCGRIWLIEEPAAGPLSDRAGAALAGADAVLYEPGLARLIAGLVPAGGYAEKLPAAADAGGLERALKLAAEGWRVVQLVRPHQGWRRRLGAAAAAGSGGPLHLTDAAGVLAAAHAFAGANGLAG